jgi:hypothetical protein
MATWVGPSSIMPGRRSDFLFEFFTPGPPGRHCPVEGRDEQALAVW